MRDSSSLDLVAVEEKAEPLPAADIPDRPTGWKWALALGALYSTALLYGLDTTISADVQPAIISSFGSIGKIAWIGAGFPLGSIAVILPLGVAYGLFNIKVGQPACIFAASS
jgi:hypothetical protein